MDCKFDNWRIYFNEVGDFGANDSIKMGLEWVYVVSALLFLKNVAADFFFSKVESKCLF